MYTIMWITLSSLGVHVLHFDHSTPEIVAVNVYCVDDDNLEDVKVLRNRADYWIESVILDLDRLFLCPKDHVQWLEVNRYLVHDSS